jgi:homoserine O-succinyltransferase/O-acetyltransferase
MPLIQTSTHPVFNRLANEGHYVLSQERAAKQDVRPLEIGICMNMPDGAVKATERQILKLIEQACPTQQVRVHFFTLPIFERGEEIKSHIEEYYTPLEDIKKRGLDAVFITGASEETNPSLIKYKYWKPLNEFIAWAKENVTSTVYSCLAAHAGMYFEYDEEPEFQDKKTWGVYPHTKTEPNHPLVRGMNDVIYAPHSRLNVIHREQFEKKGLKVLLESEEAGVLLATSADGISEMFMQGHLEYDAVSLLKEYIREIKNYIEGVREDYPEFPANYFDDKAAKIANEYKRIVTSVLKDIPEFPEKEILLHIKNPWADSAQVIFSRWIGFVYQTTHFDLQKRFMPEIDPAQPLLSLGVK